MAHLAALSCSQFSYARERKKSPNNVFSGAIVFCTLIFLFTLVFSSSPPLFFECMLKSGITSYVSLHPLLWDQHFPPNMRLEVFVKIPSLQFSILANLCKTRPRNLANRYYYTVISLISFLVWRIMITNAIFSSLHMGVCTVGMLRSHHFYQKCEEMWILQLLILMRHENQYK